MSKRVFVLTRDEQGNREWADKLAVRGFETYGLSCIRTEPVALSLQSRLVLERLAEFDWLVFTSAAGVRFFQSVVMEIGLAWKDICLMPVAVVGRTSAAVANQSGLTVAFVPSVFDGLTLARELEPVAGKKVAWVRAERADSRMAELLRRRGAVVESAVVYRTTAVDGKDVAFEDMVRRDEVAAIFFASPSAVAGFVHRSGRVVELTRKVPVIAVGGRTGLAAKRAGFIDVTVANAPDVERMAEALALMTA